MSNPLVNAFTLPCGVVVRNRIVKGAMAEGIADPATDSPNEKHVQLYKMWGETSAGNSYFTFFLEFEIFKQNIKF